MYAIWCIYVLCYIFFVNENITNTPITTANDIIAFEWDLPSLPSQNEGPLVIGKTNTNGEFGIICIGGYETSSITSKSVYTQNIYYLPIFDDNNHNCE